MTHTIHTTACPEAAEPLTKLYLASQKTPVSGRACRPARSALAAAVGPGELATLLASSAPLTVKPRSRDAWDVIEEESGQSAAVALSRILSDEVKNQGLSHREVSRRSAVPQQTVSAVLRGQREPGFGLAVRILTKGLGKSLSWLDGKLG